jgi:hypothetical protein
MSSQRSYSKPHPDAVYNRVDFAAGFDPQELVVPLEQMNRGITPEFSIQLQPREDLVDEDGTVTKREPSEIEVVRLRIAGDTCNEAFLPVDDAIRARFQTEYRAWKEDPEAIAVAARRATPLASWDQMPAGLAADLSRRHITTIEHLAHLPDSAVSAIPFGRQWRDRALGYLAQANEDSRFSELRDENAALRASLDRMAAEMLKSQELMRQLLGEGGLREGGLINGSKKQ